MAKVNNARHTHVFGMPGICCCHSLNEQATYVRCWEHFSNAVGKDQVPRAFIGEWKGHALLSGSAFSAKFHFVKKFVKCLKNYFVSAM